MEFCCNVGYFSQFLILAIAIFKPFGLEAGQWQSYLHLLSLFVLGLSSCFITEVILRYIVRMPRSYERGINYIFSRNLRFQLINTPLVALLICLYRHFVMSSLVESNRLSLNNYLETLVIIAFLSFAIGLCWRFKFRSKCSRFPTYYILRPWATMSRSAICAMGKCVLICFAPR